jgi:hypothetical protein
MQKATRTFEIMDGARIEVVKGTIIALSPWTSISECFNGCTNIFGAAPGAAFFVSGEGEIVYQG